ncbi:hypothetical protein HK405_005542 [Cladochytrium tenue]|nr:hypothetical protein HK405_005542 [Cladochytrium tenue]
MAAESSKTPPVPDADISDHYLAASTSSPADELHTAYAGGGAYVPPAEGETVAKELGDDGADENLMPYKAIPEYKVCGITLTRRRRICLYVCAAILVLILAVLVPLLVYVIGPKIAQSALNSSVLTLASTSITGATNNSFVLASTGTVTNAGFIDASISFDNPVTVYWVQDDGTNTQLGTLVLPDLSVGGSTPKSGTVTIPNNTFSITDVEAMGTFSQYLVTTDNFSWRLVGSAHAKALGLTFNSLSLDKTVTLGGFQGLKDVTIQYFNLPSSDPTTGIVLDTVTKLGNPSTITIDLGSLYFDTDFKGEQIGTIEGSNIILTPGDNYLNLTGSLKPIDSNATELLSELFTYFVGGESSPLTVITTNVIGSNGPVSWLQKGLIGVTLTVSLDSTAQKLVSNISIPSMSVVFDPSDTTGAKVLTSASVNANFKSPFDFSLSIEEVEQALNFLDSSSNVFATLNTPLSAATSDQAAGTLKTSFTNATLAMVTGQDSSYQEFFRSITLDSSYKVAIKGSVNTVANTAVGNVTINNVTLDDSITFSGFQGLSDVTVDSVTVQSGSSSGIQLAIGTTIQNPSTISIDFGTDVVMDLLYNGQNVGSVTLPKLALVPGANSVTASSVFDPTDDASVAQGRVLLSNFLAGSTSGVTIVGTGSSVPYTELQPAFDGLTISTSLPGQTTQIVASTSLAVSISSSTATTATGTAYLYINNPFEAPLGINHITADIRHNGALLGTIDEDFSASPLSVPAGSSNYQVGPVTASLTLGLDALDLVISALASADSTGSVQLNSTLITSVGGYTTTVDYAQTTTVLFS